MMLLNHILRKSTSGHKVNGSKEKIDHLIYIDDIELFAEKKQNRNLVRKSGKRHLADGMELPNQEKTRMLGENI